jgi:hypothetical protein
LVAAGSQLADDGRQRVAGARGGGTPAAGVAAADPADRCASAAEPDRPPAGSASSTAAAASEPASRAGLRRPPGVPDRAKITR